MDTMWTTSKPAVSSYGLHVLVDKDPEGLNIVDIVAIHGLNGHYLNTWTARLGEGSQVNWLRDLLPKEVPNARIMSFFYNSTVQFSKSTSDVFTFADQLLEQLHSARSDGRQGTRRLVFICHSLGGIVFKQAMNRAHESERYRVSLLDCVLGVAFFGTPHRGSSLAQWASILSGMLKTCFFGTNTNFQLARDLERKSKALEGISKSFVERGRDMQIYSFYETEKMEFMNCKVVEEESATLGWPDEVRIGIDGNHRSMVRFAYEEEPRYRPVAKCIYNLVARARLTITDHPSSMLPRKQVMASLHTSNYKTHKERNPTAVLGTCKWILSRQKYHTWLTDKTPSLLWISADAGCGKSVLSSFLIDHLKNSPAQSGNVCYFFFKADSGEQVNAVSALSAILHQLYSSQERLIEHAQEQLSTPGENVGNLRTLWDILVKSTEDEQAEPTICILDGLDECEETTRKQLMGLIAKYFTTSADDRQQPNESSRKKLRLLVTSRPDNSIKNVFDRQAPSTSEKRTRFAMMRLRGEDEIDAVSHDIEVVIKDAMDDLVDRGLPMELLEDMQRELIARADRTFLWVTLIIQLLRERAEEGASRRELDSILKSRTVDAVYQAMLCSRPNHSKARKLLSIVLAALRPLTVEELSIALAVKPDHQTFQQPSQPLRPSARTFEHLEWELVYPFENHIKGLCGHFVRVIQGKVYLVHQTAREFLLDQASLRESDGPIAYDRTKEELWQMDDDDNGCATDENPPSFHNDFADDEVNPAEDPGSAWHRSFSLVDAHVLLLEICVSYLYLLGKRSRIAGLGLGEPSKKTAAFFPYAAKSWTKHFHKVRDRIPPSDFSYYQSICHPRFPGFTAWMEAYGMTMTRPVIGGSDDEQQDHLVGGFGLEPGEHHHGFRERTEGEMISPAYLDMSLLSSNPLASQNFYFPVTADETGFVSLDFDSAGKVLRLEDKRLQYPSDLKDYSRGVVPGEGFDELGEGLAEFII